MRNITECNNVVKCHKCEINGFFCKLTYHDCATTCPLCGNDDLTCHPSLDDFFLDPDDETDYGNVHMSEMENDPNKSINKKYDKENIDFCYYCKIVYCLGSIHNERWNIYNAELIRKYSYEGQIYIGMPHFDTIEEYFEKFKNVIVLEWVTPNGNNICKNQQI